MNDIIPLKQGERDFGYKSTKDHCTEFYVLESVNPDEDAVNHFDGDIIKSWI